MKKNPCINSIDADHFDINFNLHKSLRLKRLNREKQERWRDKNQDLHQERNLKYVKLSQGKKKLCNPEEYKKDRLDASRKAQGRKKKKIQQTLK